MPLNLPYSVFGTVKDTSSSLIGSGVLVKLRNERTGELTTDTTNASSEYTLDAANFASGYSEGDKFTVYVYAQNAYAEETIDSTENKHQFHLTLVTITDSTLINYTTVQKVFDMIDEITSENIPARRVIDAVRWAEKDIEDKAGRNFKSTTVTQEIFDYNQHNTNQSPEQHAYVGSFNSRNDHWNVQNFQDRFFFPYKPIVSITTLQKNGAGAESTDSWSTLTEQTGSGGDYILSEDGKLAGFVDFVQNKPRFGKRSMRVTLVHGYATTPPTVERLTTLLAVKDILLSKTFRSHFDSPNGLTLGGIAMDRSGAHASVLKVINLEINSLWERIGEDYILV